MFEKGKIYKTVEGKPAKVLWVAYGKQYPQAMWVLHNAYSDKETVLYHNAETGHFSELLKEYNLVEEFYD